MFVLLEGMKWSHLPVAGGLYDQHPDLLDAFRLIFSQRAEFEAEEREKEKKEMENKKRNPGGSRPPRGRRR